MANRSNIRLVGNTTTGQNVGAGDGCIYKGKSSGNNLQFRSISATGNSIQIFQTDNNILISGATGGGGGGFTVACNGLNSSGGTTVMLGGNLTKDTTISGMSNTYDLSICGLKEFNVCAIGSTIGAPFFALFNQFDITNGYGGSYIEGDSCRLWLHNATCDTSLTYSKLVLDHSIGNDAICLKSTAGGVTIGTSAENMSTYIFGQNGVDITGRRTQLCVDANDITMCAGGTGAIKLTGGTGGICLSGLPAKTSETCVVYINSAGKLATGIAGTSGTAFGWSNLTCKSTVAGCGTIASGTSQNNTVYGVNAGKALTTGQFNVIVGTEALCKITEGVANTVVGYKAGFENTDGDENVAVGTCALYLSDTGYRNIAIGHQAIGNITTGSMNQTIAIGYRAQYQGCGSNSIAIGSCALYFTTASGNTAIGSCALYCNTTGGNNTALGIGAHQCNIVGGSNIAIGAQAMLDATGGTYNIAIGAQAIRIAKTNSFNNVGIGSSALQNITTGCYNIGVGYQAASSVGTTSHTVAIGFQALALNCGGCNVALGSSAGFNLTGNSVGNVFLGYQAGYTETSVSNKLWIANGSGTFLVKGCFSDCTICNGTNSTTWNTTSDIRIKENVRSICDGLCVISQLNPVLFDYTKEYSAQNNWGSVQKTCNYGFIAQEFEQVFPKYTTITCEKIGDCTIEDFRSINTGHLIPILVKAIQEQQAQIQALCLKITELEK